MDNLKSVIILYIVYDVVEFFQIYLHNALNINDLLQLPCHGLSHGLRVSEAVDVTVNE